MKRIAIFGAAALALMATAPAYAQSGYVGGVYGNADADSLGDADFYGVEAAVAGSNFELDLGVLDGDDTDSAYNVAGHLFTRNDSHLFGGFIGVSDSNDSTTWTAGVEGNKYFDNFTLAGAIAYGSNDDADADGYGLNTEARFFPTENFRLQGRLGWSTVDIAGFDEDFLSYGVGGEYQLSEMPISFALNWDTVDTDTLGFDVDTLTFGVRYNWGGTLRDRDRTGASQASLTSLSF